MTSLNDEKMAPALLLLKTTNPELRTDLIANLLKLDHVVTCEAVDGDFDIIATIEPLSGVGLDHFVSSMVKPLPTVARTELCRVDTLVDDDHNLPADNPVAESYLFVEVDDSRFQTVFQTVSLLSATASCQVAEPPCSLIVRIRGSNFDFLDKVVNEKIRPLPGVLRARQHRIIKLAGF